jgi:hypothetical protein
MPERVGHRLSHQGGRFDPVVRTGCANSARSAAAHWP